MGKIKIDWLQARQDYLSNQEISLTDISNRYAICLSRVKKVAVKERWTQLKDNVKRDAYALSYQTVSDSYKEYFTRTLKISRYLQNVSLSYLEKCFEVLENVKPTLKFALHFIPMLTRLVAMAMRLERELYPQKLIHQTAVEMNDEANGNQEESPMSPELKQIYYQIFKAELLGNKMEIIVRNRSNDKVFEYTYDFSVKYKDRLELTHPTCSS